MTRFRSGLGVRAFKGMSLCRLVQLCCATLRVTVPRSKAEGGDGVRRRQRRHLHLAGGLMSRVTHDVTTLHSVCMHAAGCI